LKESKYKLNFDILRDNNRLEIKYYSYTEKERKKQFSLLYLVILIYNGNFVVFI